ncbi:hypothetical protein FQR65_LT20642 [Abscondita terminalis]|nr:hypothetical protein FQR65_LT20642 [Abscondita terminalis]
MENGFAVQDSVSPPNSMPRPRARRAVILHPKVRARLQEIERIVITTHESAIRIISKVGQLAKTPPTGPHASRHGPPWGPLIFGNLVGRAVLRNEFPRGPPDPSMSLRQKMEIVEEPRRFHPAGLAGWLPATVARPPGKLRTSPRHGHRRYCAHAGAGDAAYRRVVSPTLERKLHNYQPTPGDIHSAQGARLMPKVERSWPGVVVIEKFFNTSRAFRPRLLVSLRKRRWHRRRPLQARQAQPPCLDVADDRLETYVDNIRDALVKYVPSTQPLNRFKRGEPGKAAKRGSRMVGIRPAEGAFSYLARRFRDSRSCYLWPIISKTRDRAPQQVRKE